MPVKRHDLRPPIVIALSRWYSAISKLLTRLLKKNKNDNQSDDKTLKHGMETGIIIGIHAAILSIIISAFAGYAIYLYGKMDDLESRVFQEATKINALSLLGKPTIGGQTFDTSSQDKQRQLVSDLEALILGGPVNNVIIRPKNPADRGLYISGIIESLRGDYPFPLPNRRVEFNNLEEVRKWSSWVSDIVGKALYVEEAYGSQLRYYVNILSQFENEEFEKYRQEQLKRLSPEAVEDLVRNFKRTSSDNIEECFKDFSTAFDISKTVDGLLKELDFYKSRQLNKKFVWVGLILAGITFIFGVIMPMINSNLPRWVYLWEPLAFYAFIFFTVLYLVARI
jgi:hypothetical protein